MTTILPLFPLGIVAFPGELVNLHIFEARYKQLIMDCFEAKKTFGIPPFIDKKLMNIGTEMEVLGIEKTYSSGEMDIKTKAIALFEVKDFLPKMVGKLYAGGDVKYLDFDTEGDFLVYQQILGYVAELFSVLNINKPLPVLDEQFNTYLIGHQVGFNVEQEYAFLKLTAEEDRQNYMLAHLEGLIPVVREMHRLQERAKLNGHFKHLGGSDFTF